MFDYFDDASLRLYYRQFFPSENLTNVDADQLKKKFKIHFHSLYGRRFYFPPVALLAANLEFNFIVDSVSQALFWVYAEDSVKDLYKLGLRGAMEVNYMLAAVAHNDEPAKQALADAATILKMSPESTQHMFSEVAHDPYTEFLVHVWH